MHLSKRRCEITARYNDRAVRNIRKSTESRGKRRQEKHFIEGLRDDLQQHALQRMHKRYQWPFLSLRSLPGSDDQRSYSTGGHAEEARIAGYTPAKRVTFRRVSNFQRDFLPRPRQPSSK